jgi:hypothetical protein
MRLTCDERSRLHAACEGQPVLEQQVLALAEGARLPSCLGDALEPTLAELRRRSDMPGGEGDLAGFIAIDLGRFRDSLR